MYSVYMQDIGFAFRTERLELRPLATYHAKDMLQLWSDPDVVRYMNLRMHTKESQSRERIKHLLDQNVKKGCPNHFVLVLDGELIGLAGFPLTDEGGCTFGFYYQIMKKYWGLGYATEAAGALLAYLFSHYPDALVYADSVADNAASMAVLQKLGFIKTRTDEKAFTKNGPALDIVHYRFAGK